MSKAEPFDALTLFAEIERLVGKIYFRFSHIFLDRPELRDFWWQMAREEEEHGCILHACKALIVNYENRLDPSVNRQTAEELKAWLRAFLRRGVPSMSVEEAFRIALEIETSELDAIYSKLISLGGPDVARTMEFLGVPASLQRQRLKQALRRFCGDNLEMLRAADRL